MIKKILIIEDEALIALELKLHLEDNGFVITEILRKGHDLSVSIKKEKPDFILLDIFLQDEINGIDLAEEINNEFKIPFAFVTGNSDPSTRSAAMGKNPVAYFNKPVNFNSLIQSIINCAS